MGIYILKTSLHISTGLGKIACVAIFFYNICGVVITQLFYNSLKVSELAKEVRNRILGHL